MKLIHSILLFSFVLSLSATAQNVEITGNSKTYAGDTLTFYTYTEYITKSKENLGSAVVDSTGKFTFNFEINETICAYIDLEVFQGKIFLEKNAKYDIVFPRKVKKTRREYLNPFFVPQEFFVRVLNSTPEELNTKIRTLNNLYNEKLSRLYVGFTGKVSPKKTEIAIKEINDSLPDANNSYFADYKKFNIAVMRYITYQHDFEKVMRVNFLQTPLYSNPSYHSAFTQVVGNYFSKATNATELIEFLTKGKSWKKMNDKLAENRALANRGFREYVLLKALYSTFYEDYSLRGVALSVLKQAETECKTAENRKIASNIIAKLGELLPGNPAPEIFLDDAKGESFSLNKMSGKFVYLNFFEKGNYVCQKEISLLDAIHKSNIDLLEIVTIWSGGTEKEMQEMVKARNYGWTFLYAPKDSEVYKEYQVTVKPHYLLIHPEGKLLYMTAPGPSEHFEPLYFDSYKKWKRELTRREKENQLGNE